MNRLYNSETEYDHYVRGELELLSEEEVDLDDETPDEEFNEDEW